MQLISERRKILDDGVPDDIEIDAEVLVNEDVAHARDVRPRNAGRKRFLIGNQVPNSFPDDFEIADYGIDGLLISLELFECETLDVTLDPCARL